MLLHLSCGFFERSVFSLFGQSIKNALKWQNIKLLWGNSGGNLVEWQEGETGLVPKLSENKLWLSWANWLSKCPSQYDTRRVALSAFHLSAAFGRRRKRHNPIPYTHTRARSMQWAQAQRMHWMCPWTKITEWLILSLSDNFQIHFSKSFQSLSPFHCQINSFASILN